MIKVEVCINCDTLINVRNSISAAYHGGASTIELCSAMHFDGLTPVKEHIVAARKAFHDRAGLMVMIRPRKGDFSYTGQELLTMHREIHTAAEAGADGVVFGVLQKNDDSIAVEPLRQLIQTAGSYGLKVTFHRAFDATPNPLETLAVLIDLGVHRVLTSGMPWGQKGTALDGIGRLDQIIKQSKGRIEIVVSGGISPTNVVNILNRLPLDAGNVSVHAYSGVQENGITTTEAVKSLVDAVSFL